MLDTVDMVVVLVYFAIILAVGVLASCKSKRTTIQGYFLAGRNMNWFLVGTSLFVSNVGSEHFIGLAGSGALNGIGAASLALNPFFLLQLLGWVFVPVYIASKTSTMPEYLEKRFGGKRLRIYLAVLSLVLYCLTKLSVNLYAGALFIQESMGWNLYISITLLISITGVLTVTGGLTVVMYTDSFQAVLMLVGSVVLTAQGFLQVGGYQVMKDKYMMSSPNLTRIEAVYNITINSTNECIRYPNPQAFNLLRGINDDDVPLLGFIFGQTPSSIWYWCADQVIVQRTLAARNLSHAQGGTILAALLKTLSVFFMLVPGLIARILYTDDLSCIPGDHCMKVCGSKVGCSNLAFPKIVLEILPSGARGLMMAVMVAALMSDLDSIFNSGSTLFTLDLWQRLRKNSSNRELMIVGRLFIIVMIGISIAWVPIILQFQNGQLYFYIQEVTNYISPPIAAIFVAAVLWGKCTEKGAFYGGLVGSLLGVARLITIFVFQPPRCGEADTRPYLITSMHYMYYAAILFFTSLVVAVVVSCFTEPTTNNIARLTYWTRNNEENIAHETELQKMNLDQSDCDDDVIVIEGNPPDSDVETITNNGYSAQSCLKTCLNFICGIGESPQPTLNEQDTTTYQSSLKQNPKTKIFLTFLLFVCLGIGAFIYIYWSI
ncbi:sodium/myo-inositol cotransporter-like [Ciona intestinalis]